MVQDYSIQPFFQAWKNMDIEPTFIQAKACLSMTSERAKTGALRLGTWPWGCWCGSHVARAIEIAVHTFLAPFIRARERLSIPGSRGTARAASPRRVPGVDEPHRDAREAGQQRRACLDLREEPVHLPRR